MKLMDEVAGIVAARHCKTNIVTASVDAINFHDKIRKGRQVCWRRGHSLVFRGPQETGRCHLFCRTQHSQGYGMAFGTAWARETLSASCWLVP